MNGTRVTSMGAAIAAVVLALVPITPAFAQFFDSDGDGVIDVTELAFGSSFSNAASMPENTFFDYQFSTTRCFDGVDNDLDGSTDGADSGCFDTDGDTVPNQTEGFFGSNPNNPFSTPEHSIADLAPNIHTCTDGIDNDGDGKVDNADSGCTDFDFDGAPAGTDNCPSTFNPNQADTDGDHVGDACDPCTGCTPTPTPTPTLTPTLPTEWQPIRGKGWLGPVAVDPAHNVVVGGTVAHSDNHDLIALKIAPDGTELWRRVISGGAEGVHEGANAVAIDASGDVIIGGSLQVLPTVAGVGGVFAVLKLDGTDGSEQWRFVLAGSDVAGGASGIAIAANGDVFAGGETASDGSVGQLTAVRLAGATGTLLWRRDDVGVSGSGAWNKVRLMASGDIALGGYQPLPQVRFVVARIASSDGAEIWRYEHSGGGSQEFAWDVTVDGNDDVIAAGQQRDIVTGYAPAFAVVKLAGGDGSELWRQTFIGESSALTDAPARAYAVVVDGNGDVVAAGETMTPRDPSNEGDLVVQKLAGADGSELWRSTVADVRRDVAQAVAVGSDGDVIAGGQLADPTVPGGGRVFVEKLDGLTGRERWRMVGTNGYISTVVIDGPSGPVVAAGVENVVSSPDMFVAKLGWATGGACGDGVLTPGVEQCDDANGATGDGCDTLCRPEEAASASATPGVPVTTDTESDGATAFDPIETGVTSPNAGTVTIVETSPAGIAPAGYEFLDREIDVSAPSATPTEPLILAFQLDASAVPFGADETTIALFRDDTLVPGCTGVLGVADADPCVVSRVRLGDGDLIFTALTSSASRWNFAVTSCTPAAPGTCRIATPPAKVSMSMKTTGKKSLQWKWNQGAEAPPGVFGDPRTTTAYTLCVVSDLTTPALRLWARAPAGATCGTKPCWKATGNGYRYKNGAATPNGIDTLTLKTGLAGKAKLMVKARGAHLTLPPFPIFELLPMRVQLQASTGECWETTFSAAGIVKNDVTQFKANGD